MKNHLTIVFIALICTSSCGKKCKEAQEHARTKPKVPDLMYIWRFTDNLIVKKSNTMSSDSGFISFKPNGDFNNGATIKSLNAVPDIWFINNNIIVKTYCADNFPEDINFTKYYLRNDTLFLNFYSDDKVVSNTETYVHFRKY
jgi:hypothetical protein